VLRDHPQLAAIGRLTLLESVKCVRMVLWDEVRQRGISFRDIHAIAREPSATDHYFRVSTVFTTVVAIGRFVGSLFSRDQRANRKESKRRQKKDAALLHRFKTQDADRARAAAALGAAARSGAERKREEKNRRRGNEINS